MRIAFVCVAAAQGVAAPQGVAAAPGVAAAQGIAAAHGDAAPQGIATAHGDAAPQGIATAQGDVVARGVAAAQPAEWHRVQIHGHPIYYAERGAGPTLVLLHGGGDSGEHSFVRQLDLFSLSHHIVAPDQVGQGRTPDVPGPLSYTAMMEDTAALLQRLKLKRADVVGFSDGGILGLMLAVRHPDMVRRLVISGVNIAPEGLNPEDLEELRASQIPKPRTIDEKLAHLWLTSPTENELSLRLLSQIAQPVLVISGDRDAITLEHTLTIFHALPDAQLCVLPGTDHATFSGRSEWLNPIIDVFLRSNP